MSCRMPGLLLPRIIRSMRRWLLLVLVVLLPLRVAAGDAMAGQMLQQLPASAAAAAPASAHAGMQHAAQHDCDKHGQAAAAAPASAASISDPIAGDCATCALCQACSIVALSPSVPLLPGAELSQPPPAVAASALASAEQLHAFKPPRG